MCFSVLAPEASCKVPAVRPQGSSAAAPWKYPHNHLSLPSSLLPASPTTQKLKKDCFGVSISEDENILGFPPVSNSFSFLYHQRPVKNNARDSVGSLNKIKLMRWWWCLVGLWLSSTWREGLWSEILPALSKGHVAHRKYREDSERKVSSGRTNWGPPKL